LKCRNPARLRVMRRAVHIAPILFLTGPQSHFGLARDAIAALARDAVFHDPAVSRPTCHIAADA